MAVKEFLQLAHLVLGSEKTKEREPFLVDQATYGPAVLYRAVRGTIERSEELCTVRRSLQPE